MLSVDMSSFVSLVILQTANFVESLFKLLLCSPLLSLCLPGCDFGVSAELIHPYGSESRAHCQKTQQEDIGRGQACHPWVSPAPLPQLLSESDTATRRWLGFFNHYSFSACTIVLS